MAIVQPGKRPAKRFEKSKVLGGKMGGGHKATNAELNVVPMVDMMTMLVIFLVNQFVVTGQKVSDVADLDRDSGYLNIPALEERLRDEKKRWEFIHQSDPNTKWDGIVNIQADTKVPFRIVKRVMY